MVGGGGGDNKFWAVVRVINVILIYLLQRCCQKLNEM